MDDDADNDDVMNDLKWFSYGYLCAEDDKKSAADPKDERMGCLLSVIIVVCIGIGVFTESIAAAVIFGIITSVFAWKLA